MARVLLVVSVWIGSVVTGLVLGGLTSLGQTYLPGGFGSFANSNGGWVLLVAMVLLAASRWEGARRWWVLVVASTLAFHSLLQGYVIVSTLRGFPDSYGPEAFYFWAAMLVGPTLGLAASWWHAERPALRALAIVPFSGVMISDGVFGLLAIRDTTGWEWWVTSIAIGVAALVWVAARRLAGTRWRSLAVALTLGGAAFLAVLWTNL